MQKSANIRYMFRSSLIVIIISSIAGTIGMLVDGILTGQFLGADALTAYGIVSPAFLILHAVGSVFSTGMQALCAGSLGSGDTKEANGIFSITTILTVLLSLVLAAAMFAFASPIAAFLGAEGSAASLLPMARDYLVGLSIGLPAILVHLCLQPVMQLDGDKNMVIISTMIMTVADIIGDLLVVFVFKNGMLGMALMTSISYILALGVYIPHFFRKNTVFRLRFHDLPWKKTGLLLATGLPTAVSRFCNTLRSLLLNRFLLMLAGSVAVTALTTQSNLNNFFASVSTGISFSVLLVVGILYGEEDRFGIRALMKNALKTGAVLVSLVSAVMFLVAPQLVSLYIQPQEAAFAMSVSCIRIFAFSMPIHVINNIFTYYLQGTGNLIKSNIICILNELVATVGCAVVLGSLFGVNGVWLAFPVGKLLTLLVILFMAWRSSRQVPKKMDDYLFLSPAFDNDPSMEIELNECSEEKIGDAARRIRQFCSDQGIEERMAEEVAADVLNVAKHIFQTNRGKNRIDTDIRLRCTDKGLSVRLRDGGKPANSSEYEEKHFLKRFTASCINTMGVNYTYLTLQG